MRSSLFLLLLVPGAMQLSSAQPQPRNRADLASAAAIGELWPNYFLTIAHRAHLHNAPPPTDFRGLAIPEAARPWFPAFLEILRSGSVPDAATAWTAAGRCLALSAECLAVRALLLADRAAADASLWPEALTMTRRAATAGSARAMRTLGWHYEYGIATEADTKAALDWYQKAATAGFARAFSDLGRFHHHGLGGLSPNSTSAASWFQKGVALGEPEAMNNLGYLYQIGAGVQKDLAAAADWFRRSAEAGEPTAIANYAAALLSGQGIPANPQEGMRLLQSAARKGNIWAMGRLADLLAAGNIVPRDLLQAKHWRGQSLQRRRANWPSDFASAPLISNADFLACLQHVALAVETNEDLNRVIDQQRLLDIVSREIQIHGLAIRSDSPVQVVLSARLTSAQVKTSSETRVYDRRNVHGLLLHLRFQMPTAIFRNGSFVPAVASPLFLHGLSGWMENGSVAGTIEEKIAGFIPNALDTIQKETIAADSPSPFRGLSSPQRRTLHQSYLAALGRRGSSSPLRGLRHRPTVEVELQDNASEATSDGALQLEWANAFTRFRLQPAPSQARAPILQHYIYSWDESTVPGAALLGLNALTVHFAVALDTVRLYEPDVVFVLDGKTVRLDAVVWHTGHVALSMRQDAYPTLRDLIRQSPQDLLVDLAAQQAVP